MNFNLDTYRILTHSRTVNTSVFVKVSPVFRAYWTVTCPMTKAIMTFTTMASLMMKICNTQN